MSGQMKVGIGAFILLMAAACGSPVYIAEDIDAQVVDAETGKPIEGVNVVANWQLVVGSLDGQRMRGQLEVMETLTDGEGRFHFDGFIKFNFPNKGLRNSDPQVIVFKSGYEVQRVANYYPRAGTETPGMIRKAAVDGRVVKLKKINLSEKAQESNDDLMVYTVTDIILQELTTKDCEWKKIPRFILAMDAEKKRILSLHPLAFVGLVSIRDIPNKPDCGSPEYYFKELKQ